jgi:hypothetical protein
MAIDKLTYYRSFRKHFKIKNSDILSRLYRLIAKTSHYPRSLLLASSQRCHRFDTRNLLEAEILRSTTLGLCFEGVAAVAFCSTPSHEQL